MQSLFGVGLPSAQLTAPPKGLNTAREDRFAPELERAAKDAERGDGLAGAASLSGQHNANRDNEGKTAEGKTAEGKTAEGKTAEGKTAEGKTAEGKTAEGKTAEGKTAEGKTAEGITDGSEATEAVTQSVAQLNQADTGGLVQASNATASEAMATKGMQARDVSPPATDLADKGLAVASLAQGAEVEGSVQNRLKGAALKTELLAGESLVVSPVADEPAAMKQIDASVLANKSGSLQDSTGVVQQGASGLINAAESGNAKAKVITDPRFADLLNKPELPASLRQLQSKSGIDPQGVASSSDSLATLLKDAPTVEGDSVQLSADGKTAAIGLSSFGADSVGLTEMQLTATDSMQNNQNFKLQNGNQTHHAGSANLPFEPALALKDGSMVPESRVVQQTIDHLSIHARGDSSSVTIKLHPEELGELQLRMVMEGDKLRVHLHTQNQQVQEVLERNFPRLRDALQDAGVNVSDFQVSSDSGGSDNQQNFAQNKFLNSKGQGLFSGFAEDDVDPLASVLAAAAVTPSDRLSVRV